MAQIAGGRANGIAQFGNTPQAFLGSLAPLIAFPLVGSALLIAGGGSWSILLDLLAAFCALLAPPVLSYELARLWSRQAMWPRFATAFNWCQWLLPVLAFALLIVLSVLMAAGFPQQAAAPVLVLALAGYGLWLHWFLARHGLNLSWLRAGVLVVCVNAGTVLLILGPRLIVTEL
ncbi:MAG: hypothetical protein JO227_12330 [Acetobacteraceae bacterium]|nr:hypothetical protein [Acetobacteraceae bacterium]